jgi:hypothetical protein
MKKKTVKMVSSIAALAVLSGAYIGVKTYVEKQEEKEQESLEEEETTTNVFSASADSIESLGFFIDDSEVVFEKDEESWKKKDETDFPVDQDAVESAVSAIESIESDRVLEDVEDLSEYGLDNPSNTITVTVSSESDSGSEEDDDEDNENTETTTVTTETVIYVGDKNDSISQYYIKLNDDDSTVYVVDSSVISPFQKTLYDYAEEESFPSIDSADITRVEVDKGNESSYSISAEESSGTWIVNNANGSESEKSDSAKATSLVSSVSSMAYDDFINYNAEDLSEYGLDEPYAEIIIDYDEEQEVEISDEEETDDETESIDETEEESDIEDTEDSDEVEDETEETAETETVIIHKQLVVHVGNETDGGRYVSVDDSKQVYTMSEDTLATFLDKENSDFWDLTVNYLSVNNLDELEVEYNGEKHSIDVSRETIIVEAEDDEETVDDDTEDADDSDAEGTVTTEEVTTYLLDGNEIEYSSLTVFYNKLINLAAQKRLTEEFKPEEKPEMTVVFTDTEGEKVTEEFYNYDTNFYAIAVDEKVYLVNKMTIKELMTAFEEVTATDDEEETSDSEESESNDTTVEDDSAEEE